MKTLRSPLPFNVRQMSKPRDLSIHKRMTTLLMMLLMRRKVRMILQMQIKQKLRTAEMMKMLIKTEMLL